MKMTDPKTIETDSRTLFLLLAEFGTGYIPVDKCAHHFGMETEEAKRAAKRQALPVPTFRLGSQKSPWLISAEILAFYIDTKRKAAEDEWAKLRCSLRGGGVTIVEHHAKK
nr:pyocin activator protein PrtN [Xylella fastidiosa subsp. sandyi]